MKEKLIMVYIIIREKNLVFHQVLSKHAVHPNYDLPYAGDHMLMAAVC